MKFEMTEERRELIRQLSQCVHEMCLDDLVQLVAFTEDLVSMKERKTRDIIKAVHASRRGKLGGPARASVLSPERRREIASQGGKANIAGYRESLNHGETA